MKEKDKVFSEWSRHCSILLVSVTSNFFFQLFMVEIIIPTPKPTITTSLLLSDLLIKKDEKKSLILGREKSLLYTEES